jgi:phosphoglycerate dehydrogenase-like enzyme
MHKVIFTGNSFWDKKIEGFRDKGIEIIKQPINLTEDELIEVLQGAQGYILGGDEVVTRRIIEAAKDLKVIAFAGAGYEQFIDVKAATERGIIVTNTPGANAQTVAELTAGFILDLVKKTFPMNKAAKKGSWEKLRIWNLEGKTLGIIGAGNVGNKLAVIMHKGFGMKILYVNKSKKLEFENMFDAREVSLKELLSQSDVVSIHVPLNSETEVLIGENELALMKPTAVLINAARAKIVDGHALYKALTENKISAAAFDGYYQEPFPKPEEDPYKLMTLSDEKFILTPHNGANSDEAYEAMGEMALEGVIDVLEGRRPKYQVN